MPQRKRAVRRRSMKSKPQTRLGVFILIAVLLFAAIWWISQPASQDKLPVLGKKIASKVDSLISEKAQQISDKLPLSKEEKEKQARTDVEKGIYSAADKLGTNEKDIKKKKKETEIFYLFPIDPNLTDLTFANIIIKGEVENMKGVFESGVEKGRRQVLTFVDTVSKQRHILELFYKRSDLSTQTSKKAIAIIVDDFGNYNSNLLTGFAQTNPAICFAILPGSRYAKETMQIARQYGHESIIHVPMEPLKYPKENPGDDAIFVQHSAGEITRRLERFINQLPYCIGINNHMGSFATSDETTMQVVMQTLKKHNLLFIDSRTANSSVAYQVAQRNMVKSYKRDVFLDEPDLSAATMTKKVSDCIEAARIKLYVIAIMHCHSQAHLDYLNKFVETIQKNGFDLVSVSSLGAYKLPEIP